MKRLLSLLFIVTCISATAYAQKKEVVEDDEAEDKVETVSLRIPTQVGNYMIGANLLFARAEFQKGLDANYNIGISPKVAFFILPNIAAGLSLDLRVEGHKGYQAISYGASPFARIYFAHDNSQRSKPLQFFIEGGIGFGGTNSWYETGGLKTRVTTNGARFYILPGIDYFLNNRVAIEAGVQYLFITGKPDAHIVGLNIGVQTFLGR
jgi:hypothetical protein